MEKPLNLRGTWARDYKTVRREGNRAKQDGGSSQTGKDFRQGGLDGRGKLVRDRRIGAADGEDFGFRGAAVEGEGAGEEGFGRGVVGEGASGGLRIDGRGGGSRRARLRRRRRGRGRDRRGRSGPSARG